MEFRQPENGSRFEWIDYARGLCIVLVVMLYATGWVEDAIGRPGWLDHVVEFSRPFRMPDFFLISGLLLSRTISRPWPLYLDRKVLHFAYFYVLWLAVVFVLLGPSWTAKNGWDAVQWSFLGALVEPFGWLWFIYMLPVFFVVTKFAVRVPTALIWTAAAALHLAGMESGIKVLDKFAHYYVFLYTGYAFAPLAFRVAAVAAARNRLTLGVLAGWAVFEAYAVFGGYAKLPLVTFALAFVGITAVIAAAALMPRSPFFAPLRYCGQNSIAIYLAFFAPAMAARAALTRMNVTDDVGTIGLLVTAAGVLGALAVHRLVRGTTFRFLFERPEWLKISSGPSRPRSAASQART